MRQVDREFVSVFLGLGIMVLIAGIYGFIIENLQLTGHAINWPFWQLLGIDTAIPVGIIAMVVIYWVNLDW
jgi:hypothetical protein